MTIAIAIVLVALLAYGLRHEGRAPAAWRPPSDWRERDIRS